MPGPLKRQNFNVTPQEEADLLALQQTLRAPSVKEAILRSARVVLMLSRELHSGKRLYVGAAGTEHSRLLIAELEPVSSPWRYLAPRPHPWMRQLYVKGRRLTAANVWLEMKTNGMTPQNAATYWDLPLAAIEEVIRYCESHRDLIEMEAGEEKRQFPDAGAPGPGPPAK